VLPPVFREGLLNGRIARGPVRRVSTGADVKNIQLTESVWIRTTSKWTMIDAYEGG
jgi:hypothetical protein